ncbi:armadillo-type protein [Leucosporidium creatinivorum]|uniref:Armadillo-type protein n=1 Tax=Leucosporidium creatinivorum TaxID=106004 RepID=A0A1Y2G5Y8_9BASI|nr:armadillo-type protein [Leucosporidium creatinivorum]
MAIAFDCLLPLAPDLPPGDLLLLLTKLKNSLIGHNQRKFAALRSGGLDSLVAVLHTQPGATAEQSFALCTQAASILGALSLPSAEAVSALLSANAHSTLIHTLTRLLDPKLPSPLPLAQQHKLAETLLRALKSLYLDLSIVVGPRAWGTDLIGNGVDSTARKDVRLRWKEDGGKGKGKEEGMEGVEAELDLQAMADHAVEELFQTTEDYSATLSPSTSSPGHASTSKRRPAGILATLLKVLIESSHLNEVPSSAKAYGFSPASRLVMADMICTLLAGTVRLRSHRLAILGGEGSRDVIAALLRLVEQGNGKVQEAALNALSSLARDFRRLLVVAGPELGHQLYGPFIADLTTSTTPSLALAAATCRTVLFKTIQSTDAVPIAQVEPLVPILLHLIEKESSLRAQANFTLAYLMADSEELQTAAVKLKVLDTLRNVLEQPPRLAQPYATPASLEEFSRTAEGALLSIACICITSESFRHQVVSAKLLPLIVACLRHPATGVRAAACHCIRGLSRSVNVLRTSLVETGAADALFELLKDEEDTVVQITAAATVSNLVLEFSPMRQLLIDQGCIKRICRLVRSTDPSLKLEALFALKNASYQSNSTFKRGLMEDLSWSLLAELIEDSNDRIAEQAICILRNCMTTYGNDPPVSGLAESEMGEERVFSLVESCISSHHKPIVVHGLYTIANLATANESCRLAIASHTELLRIILAHFVSLFALASPAPADLRRTWLPRPVQYSTDADIRTGALWAIINQCWVDPKTSTRRRPREILDKLKALGVEERLQGMLQDANLDVRERVRDALKDLSGVYM